MSLSIAKTKYLKNILEQIYDGSDSYSLQLREDKPLYEILSVEDIDGEYKMEKIIDYLSNNCSYLFDPNKKNEAWWELSDEIDPWFQDGNGKRLLVAVLNSAINSSGLFFEESILVLRILIKRKEILNIEETSRTADQVGLLSEFKSSINFLLNFIKMSAGERKIYQRFNRSGILTNTTNKQWNLMDSYCKPPREYWVGLHPNSCLYGCELEVDMVSKNKFESFCDFAVENGWFENSKLLPKNDGSLNGTFPVEWVSAPLPIEEAKMFWKQICEKLTELEVRAGHAIMNGGLHIHISKRFFGKGQKAVDFAKKIYSFANLDEALGRRENHYCMRDINASFSTVENFLEVEPIVGSNGLYLCKKNVEIIPGARHSLLNFRNDDTIECRGFDSCLNVPEKLDWLNSVVLDTTRE